MYIVFYLLYVHSKSYRLMFNSCDLHPFRPSSTHGGPCLAQSLVQGGDPLRGFQWLHLAGGILYGTVLVVTWAVLGTGLGQSQVVFHNWRAPACHEEWILGGGFVFEIYYRNLGTIWYLSCRIVNLLPLDFCCCILNSVMLVYFRLRSAT